MKYSTISLFHLILSYLILFAVGSYISTGGLKWGRDNVKNFHVNMCLYYSKGAADYVGVWDYDEFFQPRGSNKNLIDVVKAMESPTGPIAYFHPNNTDAIALHHAGWKPQRGMADGDAHPFCYLILHSVVTYIGKQTASDKKEVENIITALCYSHDVS